MNKTELVGAMAEGADISKKDAGNALNAFIDVVTDTVKDGGKVGIPGFGSFESTHRQARNGRNPQTGETLEVPAKTVPKFSAGTAFKRAVNGE